jgi:diguanylate cyclase (GGDEF)-like protein
MLFHMAARLRAGLLHPFRLLMPRKGASQGWAVPEGEPFVHPLLPWEVGARVLVMDADPEARRLEAILTREGYRVTHTGCGAEGLRLAQEQVPDLVVLDALIPGLDGYQVCARLKENPITRDIPVLFVTSLRGEAEEVGAFLAGAADFLTKPFSPAVLAARARNHLAFKCSRDRLRALSLQDALTGIANRRHFDQCLEAEWHRGMRQGRPLSLVLGDLDHFKLYNDRLGHAQGDECLRRVAEVFKGALRRPGDLAARYGGEEFACILPDTDGEGARRVAEQIREGMASLDLLHPASLVSSRVTVSLGVATVLPAPGPGPRMLLEKADLNMYQAKGQGRNRIA